MDVSRSRCRPWTRSLPKRWYTGLHFALKQCDVVRSIYSRYAAADGAWLWDEVGMTVSSVISRDEDFHGDVAPQPIGGTPRSLNSLLGAVMGAANVYSARGLVMKHLPAGGIVFRSDGGWVSMAMKEAVQG